MKFKKTKRDNGHGVAEIFYDEDHSYAIMSVKIGWVRCAMGAHAPKRYCLHHRYYCFETNGAKTNNADWVYVAATKTFKAAIAKIEKFDKKNKVTVKLRRKRG